MATIAEQVANIINKQAPALIKKQVEEKVRKTGEKVEVNLANGKLSLSGEKAALDRVAKVLK